jgi:hypothetical protein
MTTPEQTAVNTAVHGVSLAQFGDAPSSPTIREPTSDPSDDLGWDVPDEDDEADSSDENFDPEDDSDLGLDEDDDEHIGLDTDTGFEEVGDDFELDESGEGVRWTADSEAMEELPGTDADVISGEEYGWTGDDDSADPEPDDDLDADLEESLPNLDDGGAEGVEDDTDLDDFELGGMPDLEGGSEDEGEGFGIENIEEMTGVSLAEEPTLELVAGQAWKLLRSTAVRVTQIATLPEPARALAVHGTRVLVCAGDACFVAERSGLARLPVPAPGRAIATAELDGRLWIAIAGRDALYVSQDAARSFERQRDHDPPLHVALTQATGKLRIWIKNQRGMLLASDDAGRTFGPTRLDGSVHAFGADGERRVSVLIRRASRALLGASNDGGRRWSWSDADIATAPLPGGRSETAPSGAGQPEEPSVIAGRGASLIVDCSSVLYAVAGQPPRSLAPLVHGPAALLDEDDESFAYACVRRGSQSLIVRCGTRGSPPMVITALDHERAGLPRRLCASFAEGGFVTLHVATDRALLRVEASLDGDDLP